MQPKPEHLSDAYAAQFTDPSVVAAYPNRPPYPPATFPILAGLTVGSPRVVLDAGCGTGDIARHLASLVDRVDAVDVSAPMIDLGRTLPAGDDPRLRWILGRMEEADLDPPYGLITAGESLHWMDWYRVMPRFRELLVPGGVLAIVGRQRRPVPWDAPLLELIARLSTNRDFQPYDLVEELTRRGLLTVLGQAETEPMPARQPVATYIESYHSRNGLSRDRMGATAEEFDRELSALVEPFAVGGSVSFQISGRVVWGTPHATTGRAR